MTKLLTVAATLGLLAGGCDLWPRDNPLDPARCSPRCTGGQTCVEGRCVAPDAGTADADAAPDLTDGPLPADSAATDILPDATGDGGPGSCGSRWTLMPSGTTERLNAVWGTSPDDLFAVGDKGTILHYDGTSWSKSTVGSENLLALHGTSQSQVYAAGTGGTLLRYDGSTWTTVTPPETTDFHGVWTVGGDIYLAAQTGKVHHYDGTAWSADQLGSVGWTTIWGSGPSNIFVCNTNEVRRFDGNSWNVVSTLRGASSYEALWGNKTAVYAVGHANISGSNPPGVIWKYQGGADSVFSDSGPDALHAVWGGSDGPDSQAPADVVAVGNGGAVLYFDGARWSKLDHGKTLHNLHGVWRSDDNQLFAVGEVGTILHHRGPFKRLTRQTTESLTGVHGSGPTDVWVVGSAGVVLHNDGNSWAPVIADGANFRAVWVNSAGVAYTLSSVGATFYADLKKYDGSWSTEQTFPYSAGGLWGATTGELVVAAYGHVEHFTTSWASTTVPEVLQATWGSGPSDIYVVGTKGAIYHYDGNSWSADSSGVTEDLTGVWGSGSTDVYAVGKNGTVLHGSQGSWQGVATGATQHLQAVWGSGPNDVFVVGAHGAVLRYDGIAWSSQVTGTSYDLQSVWGSGSSDVYVVGGYGTVLSWCGP